MDREDAKDMINACLGEAAIDVKATRFPKAEVFKRYFFAGGQHAKNHPGNSGSGVRLF